MMTVRGWKFVVVVAVAMVLLMLPAAANASMQEASVQTVATLNGTNDLPSAPSSTRGSEVATAPAAAPSIGSPATAPPAPAMIIAARSTARENRPAVPRKAFYTLALLNHSAVAFDSWSTNRLVNAGGRELNPLLKPVAGSPALYPVMQTWPMALDYLGARMARSNKPWMRKIWWLPQTASAASSFVIGARNVSLANSSQKLVK